MNLLIPTSYGLNNTNTVEEQNNFSIKGWYAIK